MARLEKTKVEGDGMLVVPTGPQIPPIPSIIFHREDRENNQVPQYHKLEFSVFDGK